MSDSLEFEICEHEPRVTCSQLIDRESSLADDLLDCTTGGQDAAGSCAYVRDTWNPSFWVIKPSAQDGVYRRRLASPQEIVATCAAIYFEHEPSEFEDSNRVFDLLIWEGAHAYKSELESE